MTLSNLSGEFIAVDASALFILWEARSFDRVESRRLVIGGPGIRTRTLKSGKSRETGASVCRSGRIPLSTIHLERVCSEVIPSEQGAPTLSLRWESRDRPVSKVRSPIRPAIPFWSPTPYLASLTPNPARKTSSPPCAAGTELNPCCPRPSLLEAKTSCNR